MLTRHLVIGLFLLLLAAAPAGAEFPRIRALDSSITRLLAFGIAKSATFTTLVNHLEQSDVIVHIERWPPSNRRRSVGGLLRFATRAGGVRYLRITIDVTLPHDRAVALLGHELQHAIEVATDDTVVNEARFEMLYRRIGEMCRHSRGRTSYDTAGAREVERAIMRELRLSSGPVSAWR